VTDWRGAEGLIDHLRVRGVQPGHELQPVGVIA